MIPQTVVAFFFFLLLVAPGVCYELLSERRRPSINETAFREAARVALYSFGFSFSACVIIALLRIQFPTALFDPAAYSHDSKTYLKTFFTAVIWTVVIEVFIAFALVLITDLIFVTKLHSKLSRRLPKWVRKAVSSSGLRKPGIWWQLFEYGDWRNKNTIPQLSIRLSDGSRMSGYLAMYTTYNKFENAEIAITKGIGEDIKMRMLDQKESDPNDATTDRKPKELPDDVVWVRGEDISYIKVKYKKSDVIKKKS